MENIPPELLLGIWQKGKALNEAIWVFCDPIYIKEYERISLTGDSFNKDAGLHALSRGLQKMAQLQNAEDKLFSDLYKRIKAGELIAIGYEPPIKSSDYPKIIPLHLWPPEKTDKIKSSISGNGLNFLSIRIVRKSAIKNKTKTKAKLIKEIALPIIKPTDKRIGRPSLKEKIISAYSRLKKDGRIDYSKTLKSHTELIQKAVQILFPEVRGTAGMENEAIRRAIGDIFKADKKTSKPTSKL